MEHLSCYICYYLNVHVEWPKLDSAGEVVELHHQEEVQEQVTREKGVCGIRYVSTSSKYVIDAVYHIYYPVRKYSLLTQRVP